VRCVVYVFVCVCVCVRTCASARICACRSALRCGWVWVCVRVIARVLRERRTWRCRDQLNELIFLGVPRCAEQQTEGKERREQSGVWSYDASYVPSIVSVIRVRCKD
jgi:hypothetical protein